MRIWGMSLSDMARFSTPAMNPLGVRGDRITLTAGDEGSGMSVVFDGNILRARIDYSGAPEVSFSVFAQAAFFAKLQPAAPTSLRGSQDVAGMLQALAASIGFAFEGNEVNVKVSNPYLCGTALDQVTTLIHTAGLSSSIENGTIAVWEPSQPRGTYVVNVSPTQGLVGYPEMTESGMLIKTLFNPNILIGRRVQLTSSALMATGDWQCQSMRHEISSELLDGPWFTTMNLSHLAQAVSIPILN